MAFQARKTPDHIVLIAHRGGMISPDAPENSQPAIEAAARAGFQMVELDLRETLDQKAVLLHAYSPAAGLSCKEYLLDQLTQMCHRGTSVPLLSFRQGLELCMTLNLGILIDIKLPKDEPPALDFLTHINQCLEQTNFHLPLYCLAREKLIQDLLSPVIQRRLTTSDLDRISTQEITGSLGKFWFGSPGKLTPEFWELLQKNRITTIPAINRFRYHKNRHLEEAKQDIHRLLRMGIHYFQIDGEYLEFFRIAPNQE